MTSDLYNIRKSYNAGSLLEKEVSKNPFIQFKKWFDDVLKNDDGIPNAMILATADEEGKPSARVVLLKDFSEQGFVFFSNSLSKKGIHISFNPNVALLFYWPKLERQVRIEGQAGMISEVESDEYFNSRPEEHKIASIISPQSEIISGREYLESKFIKTIESYKNKPLPRPVYWVGYQVTPAYFEFWQGRENRLHDRIIYNYDFENSAWIIQRLAP